MIRLQINLVAAKTISGIPTRFGVHFLNIYEQISFSGVSLYFPQYFQYFVVRLCEWGI